MDSVDAAELASREFHILNREWLLSRLIGAVETDGANAEILERMLLVERQGLSWPVGPIGIGKTKDQGARAVVVNCTDLVLVIAMDVSIEHGDVVVGGENVHDLIAVAGEPFPVRTEIA